METTQHLQFLPQMRREELRAIRSFLPPVNPKEKAPKLLEIGAGTGFQASLLANCGYEVVAIDLDSSAYASNRVFQITEYDGATIPYPAASFDAVYSSHVLEHVENLEPLLEETRRVLKPGGVAIHLIPSAESRVWTFFSHYLWLGRRMLDFANAQTSSRACSPPPPRVPRLPAEWLRTLFPARHGERGSTLSEFVFYRRRWWHTTFVRCGFSLEATTTSRVFGTMANGLAGSLSIKSRSMLSGVLGSNANIYVLRPLPSRTRR